MDKGLFIVNGMGLGNATRSEVLLSHLKDNYNMDLATSGTGLDYFKQAKLRPFTLKEILSRNVKGKVTLLRSLLLFPLCFYHYFHNVLKITKLIRKNNYRFIVIDSDYTIVFWRWFYSGPVFALNNSVWVKQIKEVPDLETLRGKIHFQIERLDYLIHSFFVNRAFYPMPIGQKAQSLGNFNFVKPLTRPISNNFSPTEYLVPQVLVIPSGSGCGLSADIVQQLEMLTHIHFHIVNLALTPKKNFTLYPLLKDLSPLYSLCDFVVSNAGWSTLCEIIDYGKTGFILPIEGHAEQIANSLLVKHLPHIHILNRNNFLKVIQAITSNDTLEKDKAAEAASFPIASFPSAHTLLIEYLNQTNLSSR